MKKITVFGGGTGMSTLLKGLKEFPVELDAVVSVCDDGRSTGKLRKEFNIPAMGDIRKVIISLSKTEPLMEQLLNYRFETYSDLNEHTVGNLLLTAGSQVTGNLSDGIKTLSKVLNLQGKVIPFSEDDITLVGLMENDSEVEGESEITNSPLRIKKVYYKEEPKVCEEVIESIRNSDLIIFSMGSLYTSIIPNLLSKQIINEIDKSKSKLMYICNMMTQPGETDNMSVSNHISIINEYLGKRKIDVVVANNGKIDSKLIEKYSTLEQKDPVLVDKENINIELLEGDFVNTKDGTLKHNYLKLASTIFSYLLDI